MKVPPPPLSNDKAVSAATPQKTFRVLVTAAKGPKSLKLPGTVAPKVAAPRTPAATTTKALPTVACATSATVQAEKLTAARSGMNAEATRLGEVRSEGAEHQREAKRERHFEVLEREVKRDEATQAEPQKPLETIGPVKAAPAHGNNAEAKPAPQNPGATARQLQEVVEKIDVLVRSNRPALALTLKGALAGELQVDRTGPREVAVRFKGENGPPTAEVVSRIREELSKKGLRLSALQVA